MKVYKSLIHLSVMVIIGCLVSITPVFAQGPEDEVQEETLTQLPPSGRLTLTLQDLGRSTELLTPGSPRSSFRVDLPGNFEVLPDDSSYFDLVISHVPAVPEDEIALQFNLNRQFVSLTPLTESNAVFATTRVDLGNDLLQNGSNVIVLSLNVGGGCDNPAEFLNVTFHDDSAISFNYQQVPYSTDLALYPGQFIEESLLNISTTVVVPDQPTSADLSAALTLAAGLGQRSGGTARLNLIRLSNLTPEIQENNHLIFVGNLASLDVLSELDLPFAIDDPALETEYGLLELVVSPWNEYRLALVVTGVDDIGLLKASQALNRRAHFLGLRGPVAVVVDVKPLEGVESIRSTGFSLSELGYEEQVVYGTLPQENTFDFFLPLGWQTTEQPYFVLKFAHAEIISGESVLDVSLNGIPVGSTLLNVDNAREGELLISLPSHLLRSGRNQLTTGVEMAIADIDPCAGAGNKRAWTVINSESEISLPYQTINLPADLSLLPYPFSQPIGFDDTVFVLPDQTSDQLLEQLTQIAIQLGSATTTDSIVVETQYASEAVPADLTGKHLIVIGRPSANNLIAQINHDLPQPFIPDTDILQPLIVDSVAFLPDLSRDAGLIELLSSPWSKDDTILAITGTTDEGVVLAIQAITDSGLRLSGNLAVVEPTGAGLDEEQAQISSYSIDTRATQVVEDEAETTSKTEIEPSSERILISLASRWWK